MGYPKFKLTPEKQQILLDEYLPYCEIVPISEPPPEVPSCRDPKDMPFLWLVVAGQADALVSGDKDLLDLSENFSIPILTPAEFRERLGL